MERPRIRQGFAIFLTGLSGAGKTTLANVLQANLSRIGDRRVTLLDGDQLRKHLCSDLGFSKEDRDRNIRRIGSLAGDIAAVGGIAICAAIAPYDLTRKEVRARVEGSGGGFLLVHVATPLHVCEQRDHKGLYAKARAGEITHFTGVSDPYEVPSDAELVIDTTSAAPEESADAICALLHREGYLPRPQTSPISTAIGHEL